ncbi:cation channel family protein (macronuclear) [Tetrahymena thermophila SB210]|uniref:Cation channel family protein n=1 Tax=Tetrahymena thermophila (strain SB210) TaxID=312017 RepID=Q233Q2_TETTS|nr:cation channel family protein [Tetrahymena thermophila SB210]EAR91777.2 cation channel family protein [Tetrahymena thermophila SB210]|eukprot:XP_001012022.2 cation channel family protein [Tetrahymena thermophila SB210]
MTLLIPIIFKHNDFYVIIKKLKQKFLLDRRAQNIIELINLLKNILVISHIFACIWLFIGLRSEEIYNQSDNDSNIQQPISWLDLVNVTKSEWYVQYLNSYYFIAVTMSTVGYGDIRATNPIEVLVAVFFVMTCSVIYGFTLNSIGEIFQDFFQFEKQIQEKRYVIANYMNKYNITQETRQSIFEYLEYYWKDKINENTQEENNIISQLSDNLKEDLLIQSNRLIFKENRVLKDNFSHEILTKCLPIIQEIRFTQNEVIIDEQNGNSDCSIYFILYGEVEVIHRQSNLSTFTSFPTKQLKSSSIKYKQISVLSKGESFGEKSFFTGQKKSLTFRSKSFSKLLKIKREDFINILQGDQEQFEIFCSINDRLTFSTNQGCLQLQCQSCKDNTHDMIQCPFLHFVPRKLKLLGNIKRSEPHLNRMIYQNRRNYKLAALENNNLIQSCCAEFFENNQEDITQYENQYHTFRQFLGSRTLFISDEEIDQNPRSLKESTKEKRRTTSDFSDSSQLSQSKKFNFPRKIGFQLNGSGNNQTGNASTKDQFYQEFCHTLDELFFNTATLLNPHINRAAVTKDLDAIAKQNQETDTKQDTASTQNSTALIEKQIQYSRQQFLRLQLLKEGQKVQFSEKGGMQSQKEKTQQSFQLLKQDYTEYDLFGGEFEKMATFSKYFPKYNFRNVIGSINKIKKHRSYIKDSVHVNTSRRINRNIQTVINRDINTSRSLSRLKIKIDTPTSRENTLIKHINSQQNGTSFINSSNIKLKTSYLHSLSASSQNESNVDVVVIKNQQICDEPSTPVQNEHQNSKQEIQSLRHFKTQQYFNLDDTQLNSVRKDNIEISTHPNYLSKLEEQAYE